MPLKVGIVLVWATVLVSINKFVIDDYWGQLAVTAACAAGMAYCLGKTDRTP
ncbi:hypothetical protein [Streptomyces sp. NBC_00083]|uniref:hypothetical protein n=1 Tax=Streptomyces sp. NBC_00083 TaxID=2975647 RepID=UPI0022510823|nr:hypothetical protein [Streptomyces sp. NBC_00083]MCX5388144.1 hypothetical protein [Streptomyces sp. NBC_00083]